MMNGERAGDEMRKAFTELSRENRMKLLARARRARAAQGKALPVAVPEPPPRRVKEAT